MCLAFFPPSAGFQPYLLGYIQRHLDAGGGGGGGGGMGSGTDTLEARGGGDAGEGGSAKWSIHAQISHYAGADLD